MKDKVCPKCGAELRWVQRNENLVGCCVCNPAGPVIAINPPALDEPWRALQILPGVSSEIARALWAMGLHTIAAIQAASDEVLLSVSGIGPIRAAKIRGLIKDESEEV